MTRHIYLDHCVWIKLARAAAGEPDAIDWSDPLDMARIATQSGSISLPLSSVHYMELHAGGKPHQRATVAPLMLELSRGHTMIGMSESILDMEIDLALKKRIGRPYEPRRMQVFGLGVGHAMGHEDFRMEIRDLEGRRPPDLPPALLQLEQWAREVAEQFLLRGPAEGEVIPGYDPKAHTHFDDIFVQRETDFADALTRMPKTKHADMHMARIWIQDMLPALERALRNAGLPYSAIPLSTKGDMTAFLQDIPTAWTLCELRRLHHDDARRTWKTQDHMDLQFLTVGLNYCDAVMPDKAWASLARRTGIGPKRGCHILSTPKSLLSELVRF